MNEIDKPAKKDLPGRVSVPEELLRDLWKLYNYIDFCAEDFDSVVRKHIGVFDQMKGE